MYKPDTILWGKESDNYTQRAKNLFKDNLYSNPKDFRDAERIENFLSLEKNNIKSILDVGCAYGSFAGVLAEKFPAAKILGIDPGKKSISLAKKHFKEYNNLSFYVGHSHKIDSNKQFDLIVLRMVLQWIPREYLIKTIAEIDRLCKRYIYIKEYYAGFPKTSVSAHNQKVRIFKQDYGKIFDSLPNYEVMQKK